MEILLIIRFCCNCTYGNPGPLSREVVSSHPWGWLEWAEMWLSRFRGQQGREGAQVAGSVFTPCWPASSLELKSGGHSGQGGLEMEGPGWKGPGTSKDLWGISGLA